MTYIPRKYDRVDKGRGHLPPQITPPPNSDRQRGIILEFGFGHF